MCCLSKFPQWPPLPHPGSTLGPGHLFILSQVFSPVVASPDPVTRCGMQWLGPWILLDSGWGTCWGDRGKPAATRAILSLPSQSHLEGRPVAHSSPSESRLPTALLYVLAVLQPSKVAGLPHIGLQPWGAQSGTLTSQPLSTSNSSFPWVPFQEGKGSQPDGFSSLASWLCVDLS